MTTHGIEIGDLVECIEPDINGKLRAGQIYIATEVYATSINGYFSSRFKLHKKSPLNEKDNKSLVDIINI